jgi:hypothetical protein
MVAHPTFSAEALSSIQGGSFISDGIGYDDSAEIEVARSLAVKKPGLW